MTNCINAEAGTHAKRIIMCGDIVFYKGDGVDMKKKSLLLIILTAAFLVTSCGRKMTEERIGEIIGTDELKSEYYFASFVINTDELSEVTTFAKYIFVGTVEEYLKTEYSPESDDEIFTYYSVKVLENVKGELVQDRNIEVKKAGGITKNQDAFLLCVGDILPAVGGTYIFAAVMFESDGSIYCFGPNTVRQIENADDYKNDSTYISYVDAMKTVSDNVPAREWPMSRYDVLYKE